jgi:HEAT repeat protein
LAIAMNDVPREPANDQRSDPDVPADIRYDPDLAVHEPAEAPGEPAEPSRRRSPLLLFPLGLFLLAVTVYIVFGLIANEGKAPADYLDEIRLRRVDAWEPAFQLSRLLAEQDAGRLDPRFVPDLITAFESSRDEDPRVRRYLALSLGEVRDPRAVEPLLEALGDADVQTAIYAAWALGTIGDPRAASGLIPLLDHEDAGLRKIAAYALGALDAPESLPPLRALLHDPVEDVAWNAALSLARRGDSAGLPLLRRMLDRSYLDGVQRADESGRPRALTEEQKEDAIKNALRSLALLRDSGAVEQIATLRDSDPNLRVRQEAFECFEAIRRARPR